MSLQTHLSCRVGKPTFSSTKMKYNMLLLPVLLVFTLLSQVRHNEAKDAVVVEALVNRQLFSKPENNVKNTLVKKSQECEAESRKILAYHHKLHRSKKMSHTELFDETKKTDYNLKQCKAKDNIEFCKKEQKKELTKIFKDFFENKQCTDLAEYQKIIQGYLDLQDGQKKKGDYTSATVFTDKNLNSKLWVMIEVFTNSPLLHCPEFWQMADTYAIGDVEKSLKQLRDTNQTWYNQSTSYIGGLSAIVKKKTFKRLKMIQAELLNCDCEDNIAKTPAFKFAELLLEYTHKKYGKFYKSNFTKDEHYKKFRNKMRKLYKEVNERGNIKIKLRNNITNNVIVGTWEKIRYASQELVPRSFDIFQPLGQTLFSCKDKNDINDIDKCKEPWYDNGLRFFTKILKLIVKASNDEYAEDIDKLKKIYDYYKNSFYSHIYKNTISLKAGINTIRFDFLNGKLDLKKELENITKKAAPQGRRRLLDEDNSVEHACDEFIEGLKKVGEEDIFLSESDASLDQRGPVFTFDCHKGINSEKADGICACLKIIAEEKSSYEFQTHLYDVKIEYSEDEDALVHQIKRRADNSKSIIIINEADTRIDTSKKPEIGRNPGKSKKRRRRLLQQGDGRC